MVIHSKTMAFMQALWSVFLRGGCILLDVYQEACIVYTSRFLFEVSGLFCPVWSLWSNHPQSLCIANSEKAILNCRLVAIVWWKVKLASVWKLEDRLEWILQPKSKAYVPCGYAGPEWSIVSRMLRGELCCLRYSSLTPRGGGCVSLSSDLAMLQYCSMLRSSSYRTALQSLDIGIMCEVIHPGFSTLTLNLCSFLAYTLCGWRWEIENNKWYNIVFQKLGKG